MNSIYRKLQILSDANLTIHKNCTAHMSGRQYKYADLAGVLESLRPALKLCKLVIVQVIEGQNLVTRLIDSESGEMIESVFPMDTAGMTWHQVGSSISYARRYAILAMLNLCADDDDDAVSTIQEKSFQASQPLDDCPHCGEPMTIGPKTGKPYCKPCYLAKRNGYAAMA